MAQPTIKVAKLPAGWKENPNPGSMRAASYLVSNSEGSEAEVAVIPMPGMANIELQLVNMWREQAKLPTITEAELGGQSVAVPSPERERVREGVITRDRACRKCDPHPAASRPTSPFRGR